MLRLRIHFQFGASAEAVSSKSPGPDLPKLLRESASEWNVDAGFPL